MNEHGVYPLRDTPTNDALLQTVCGYDVTEDYVSLYVDAKGLHLVWRTVKLDKNGEYIWNGGNLLLDTKSADVTAEFAAKLDYDGEAPEIDDGYMFTLCGLKDDNGTHLSHVFATDGKHRRLLLAPDSQHEDALLEHLEIAELINDLTSEDIEMAEKDADILSKAKELLK